jgi:hypothetical protein
LDCGGALAFSYAQIYLSHDTVVKGVIPKEKEYLYFQYSKTNGEKLRRWKTDWAKCISSFPATQVEIFSAIDCYALGHNTASVFHSMRIAEHGLRALARERRIRLPKDKPVEWGTWQDILKEIGKEVIAIGQTKPAGATKDAALSFYSGALADLTGFKDEYRNLVMHVRADHDEYQALRALTDVHGFMERLAAKIDHTNQRIKWGRF